MPQPFSEGLEFEKALIAHLFPFLSKKFDEISFQKFTSFPFQFFFFQIPLKIILILP